MTTCFPTTSLHQNTSATRMQEHTLTWYFSCVLFLLFFFPSLLFDSVYNWIWYRRQTAFLILLLVAAACGDTSSKGKVVRYEQIYSCKYNAQYKNTRKNWCSVPSYANKLSPSLLWIQRARWAKTDTRCPPSPTTCTLSRLLPAPRELQLISFFVYLYIRFY